MKVNMYCINFGLSCLAVVKMAERCSIFFVKIAMDLELQSNKNQSLEEILEKKIRRRKSPLVKEELGSCERQ